ncbi:MAG: sulfate ABC transporter permease subunit CysT [Gammaproteobacteria bacterium]|nr:sulfate ABC transporter permease subunit CysT [Gammaproteobacteria bacterium]
MSTAVLPTRAPWGILPRRRQRSALPGFGLTLGFTLSYLGFIVLLPIIALFIKAMELSLSEIWDIATEPRAMASYRLSFGGSFIAASINMVFGLIVAWVLVRYQFPGKKLIDALVDLPFALPTAVAGIALTGLYASTGWIGQYFEPFGIRIAYTQIGVIIALTFIGLPFVVRIVQPVLQDLEAEVEEAAASLGASRWQTFARVLFPALLPALLTGFALAFARAVGEFGSVIFIAGNIPFDTEITPLLIFIKLEQYDFTGAAALGAVMLVAAFVLLLVINMLQAWASTRSRRA